jgi:hypothetical protein
MGGGMAIARLNNIDGEGIQEKERKKINIQKE